MKGFVKFKGFDCSAKCDDCDWESHAKNAHGTGAQHAYKTGHTVHIERHTSHTITKKDSDWHKDWCQLKRI